MLFGTVLPVEACETNPNPPTNPTTFECKDLGSYYKLGFRINGAKNGDYAFTPAFGKLTGGAPADPAHGVNISGSTGKSFNWTSNLPIDAVIVSTTYKPSVYKYDDLTSGTNYKGKRDSRGRYYPITKIEFCYNYNLTVTQTSTGTSGGRSISWDITKTMTPASQVKFAGEAAKFDYTVSVAKTVTGTTQEGTVVTGELTITNETPVKAYISYIKIRLNPGWVVVTLDCGDVTRLPHPLYPGKSVTCTYEKPLDAVLENGTATAWVVTQGSVTGRIDTVPIEWTQSDVVSGGFDSVTVTDSQAAFGGPYTVSDSTTWTYSVDMPCPTDPSAYTDGRWTGEMVNTAAITETSQSASQTAALECYAPLLSQTAGTSLSRQYLWGIDKTSPITELLVDLYNSEYVPYTVTMSVLGTTDNNQKITGSVTMINPHPSAALTGELAGEVAPGTALTLTDCTNPVTIPAAGTLTCNFEAMPPTSDAGTSTAALSFNGLTFTTAVAYDFNNGTKTETDRCVTVTDDKYGDLGSACADAAPAVFNYELTVGGYTRCGAYTYDNTASFVTNDTLTTGQDTWTISIPLPCDNTCVSNLDYWEGHSDPTADPESDFWYDDKWNQVGPSGPATPFFDSGLTWAGVLGVNPRLNAYYAMGQQYMAAKLNVIRGVDASVVLEPLAQAEALLAEYDTQQALVTGDVLAQFNALKTVLNNWNEGKTGPELCCY